jgi:hypothetical protein
MAKIRKECLGMKIKHENFGKWFTISEGNEGVYKALKFDVFEKKTKSNVENKKGPSQSIDGNGI